MSIPKNRDNTSNRVPKTIVETRQEAADLTGATLNQFMVQAALEKAEKLIAREKNIYFSKNDAAMIVNLLDNPAKPNAALVRAFEMFTLREIENGNRSSPGGNNPQSAKI
jgi:uncharacterized protein (DUF1778 family)